MNNQQNIIDFALAIDYEKVQNDIEYMNENIKNCFLFDFLLEYGDISAWNNFEGILDKLCKQIQRYCDEVEGLPNINQNIKYMEDDIISAIRLLRFTKGCFNPEPAMVGNSKRANDFLKDRISECKAEFITCLKSQIDLFNKLFMIYLKLIEMVLYTNFNILENITNDDLVVSFNYSTTVNKINNNIYNIHYIHSNIIYRDIITGISNEDVTKDFAPLIKSF